MFARKKMHSPTARYGAIDPNLFIEHRRRLSSVLLPNSVAVVHANDVMPTNADGVMRFHQNSDLFYLSGIDQEETILLLYPDAKNPVHRTMLFIKESTPLITIWEGAKYTHQEACEGSGIAEIRPLSTFKQTFHTIMGEVDHIYLNSNEHPRSVVEVATRDARFIQWCQTHYPLHQYKRLAPIMRQLRMTKARQEIALIRRACQITRDGFKEMLPLVRNGVMEYELEAALAGSFLRRGSDGFGYMPIIGSGKRACILHYVANNQPCQTGEAILLDVGASYARYSADMTRVVPVNGRFSKRQKEVYNGVLHIMQEAKKLLTVGSDLTTYNQQIVPVVEEVLLKLRLLTKKDIQDQHPTSPAYRQYFMHGMSHHLGLDVHDVGDTFQKFAPDMVFTIEPGIYIPQESIGIRLENTFVIHHDGLEDLMHDIPLAVEEIEGLMHTS